MESILFVYGIGGALMSGTPFSKAALPAWDEQLIRLPYPVAYAKFDRLNSQSALSGVVAVQALWGTTRQTEDFSGCVEIYLYKLGSLILPV